MLDAVDLVGEKGTDSRVIGNGSHVAADSVQVVDSLSVRLGQCLYVNRFRACRLNLGGVDFAIIEDRKFKTGPLGRHPMKGPRPDHILDPAYDPVIIDTPGLQLLGERQLIIVEIESIQTSCGFGVPFFTYTGERETLLDYAVKKGPEGMAAYRAEKNTRSIDGLPTGLFVK
jgi:hypothetical protein